MSNNTWYSINTMGKLVVTEFVSLDGVMQSPGPDGSSFKYAGWTMAYGSEKSMQFKAMELFGSDALLLGRSTYEGFAKAWPTMQGTGEFGEKMNSMPKYVVSDNMSQTHWDNSHIIGSKDIFEEVPKLKQKYKKDILVNGSSSLLQTLMKLKLVDQYRLMVYPIVLGTGKKLFEGEIKARLELISTENFETGVVLLVYKSAS